MTGIWSDGPSLPELDAYGGYAPPRCAGCLDEGYVCEDHETAPWEGLHGTVEGHAEHGGAGMPCPDCCSPIPEDGRHSITEAFVPDWKREDAATEKAW